MAIVASQGHDSRPADVHTTIARHEAEFVEDVRRYLRQPGFSDTGEGIRESAELTREFLARIAPDARIVETPLHPVVYGTVRSRRPDAKTLIVYGLYDQTPLLADEWSVDPLGASIVPAERIGLDPGIGSVIVSRAAHNHRGPVLSTILAVEQLLKVEHDVPVNLLFVIEGEEEIGSPSLAGFVDQHSDELSQAQGCWLPCMSEGAHGGSMAVQLGVKGCLWVELECRGGEWGGTRDGRHLWAGHQAWVDAPMMRLIHAVGSLYDADQHCAVDGLEGILVPPSREAVEQLEATQQRFRENPQMEAAILRTLDVGRLRGGKPASELIERFLMDVTVNVQGIVGGYMGPAVYTMLPGSARAKLDFRLPSGTRVADFERLLRAHLERRGFSEMELVTVRGYESARTPAEDPLTEAAIQAAAAHGTDSDVLPASQTVCPASTFQKLGLGLPFSFTGLGNGDRPHAPDEYIQVGAIRRLMDFTATYLHAWGELDR